MSVLESFPCIICGKSLYRCSEEYEAQPDDGVMCSTSGNYGSTVYDPLDGEYLQFNICDGCLVKAGEQGRVFVSRSSKNVVTEVPISEDHSTISMVGTMRVERPFIPWHKDLPGDDGSIYFSPEELVEYVESGQAVIYSPRQKFSLNIDPSTLIEYEGE